MWQLFHRDDSLALPKVEFLMIEEANTQEERVAVQLRHLLNQQEAARLNLAARVLSPTNSLTRHDDITCIIRC
jgi:hypothetical protein